MKIQGQHFAGLNSDDIESKTELKAAALYGLKSSIGTFKIWSVG